MSSLKSRTAEVLAEPRCSTLCPYYCNGNCPHHPSKPESCGYGATLQELYPDDLDFIKYLYDQD